MDKKYQIFISSTYEDLKEERQEVLKAILKLNHIPTGMELFHASNDDQWKVITRVIDECDYYLLIIGGRYSSLDNEGVSYTEKEFIYAKKIGKPILAFLPKDEYSVEQSEPNKDKLNNFKTSVMDGKLVAYWENKHHLNSEVILALNSIMEDYPSVGWIRGDLSSEGLIRENSQLKTEIRELKSELKMSSINLPKNSAKIAHGDDIFEVSYTYSPSFFGNGGKTKLSLTWNEIFRYISPHLVKEMEEKSLKQHFSEAIFEDKINVGYPVIGNTKENFLITENSFQTIKIQLMQLKLIDVENNNSQGIKNTGTYWRLTEDGHALMLQLCTIQKE
ncbi:MAG: DUF4062 domain-containing protein [Candidatus Pacebacteria bacterium]|nr:DUF4062 domain-containing protein [Candidatus Paceibacterota bacterium]